MSEPLTRPPLDKMREAAEAIGNVTWDKQGIGSIHGKNKEFPLFRIDDADSDVEWIERVTSHVAANSPAATLALLDYCEALERELADVLKREAVTREALQRARDALMYDTEYAGTVALARSALAQYPAKEATEDA